MQHNLPEELLKKPVTWMTGEEFLTLMSAALVAAIPPPPVAAPTPVVVKSVSDTKDIFTCDGKKYGEGVKAVMKKFHCGRSRATDLLQNELKDAVVRINSRRILVDLEKMDTVYAQQFKK